MQPLVPSCPTGIATLSKYYVLKPSNFYIDVSKKRRVTNDITTKLLGHPDYQNLTTNEVLQGLCETKTMIFGQIIEADGNIVQWQSGWVDKSKVGERPTPNYAAGLLWDIDNDPYFSKPEKLMYKIYALNILQNDPNCANDSFGESNPHRKGEYFLTCINRDESGPFNIWFTAEQAHAAKLVSFTQPVSETEAVAKCDDSFYPKLSSIQGKLARPPLSLKQNRDSNGGWSILELLTFLRPTGQTFDAHMQCVIAVSGNVKTYFLLPLNLTPDTKTN